jgi:hypothetical protein
MFVRAPFGRHAALARRVGGARVAGSRDYGRPGACHGRSDPPAIIGEPSAGWIAEGAAARLVLLAARTLDEAMCRPQADRIVLHAGRRVTNGVPDYAELDAVM